MTEEIVDMSETLAPKSDQLNYDDFNGEMKTIKITKVTRSGSEEQPYWFHYEGGDGRPYKPNKGMRRIIHEMWGKAVYNGRQLTLVGNSHVLFKGKEAGGIQVALASHIDKPHVTTLTLGRGRRVPYTVGVIEDKGTKLNPLTEEALTAIKAKLGEAESMAELQKTKKRIDAGKYDAEGTAKTDAAYKESVARVREAAENVTD